jgi:hypothetical protein
MRWLINALRGIPFRPGLVWLSSLLVAGLACVVLFSPQAGQAQSGQGASSSAISAIGTPIPPSPFFTATPTPKPAATATPKPTATPTPKPTATATPKPTATPTPKPTATATPRPTATATSQPRPSPPTSTPTALPTPTATTPLRSTATPTATAARISSSTHPSDPGSISGDPAMPWLSWPGGGFIGLCMAVLLVLGFFLLWRRTSRVKPQRLVAAPAAITGTDGQPARLASILPGRLEYWRKYQQALADGFTREEEGKDGPGLEQTDERTS